MHACLLNISAVALRLPSLNGHGVNAVVCSVTLLLKWLVFLCAARCLRYSSCFISAFTGLWLLFLRISGVSPIMWNFWASGFKFISSYMSFSFFLLFSTFSFLLLILFCLVLSELFICHPLAPSTPRQTYPITRTITIMAKLSIKEVISPQWPMLWLGWAPLHHSLPCPAGPVPSAACTIASCSAPGVRKPLRDSRWLENPQNRDLTNVCSITVTAG